MKMEYILMAIAFVLAGVTFLSVGSKLKRVYLMRTNE